MMPMNAKVMVHTLCGWMRGTVVARTYETVPKYDIRLEGGGTLVNVEPERIQEERAA